MKWTSATARIAGLGLTCALLWSAGTSAAISQTAPPPEAPATLNAIDFNFVGQANLGAPFQVDSGRLDFEQMLAIFQRSHTCAGLIAKDRSFPALQVRGRLDCQDAVEIAQHGRTVFFRLCHIE